MIHVTDGYDWVSHIGKNEKVESQAHGVGDDKYKWNALESYLQNLPKQQLGQNN